MPRVRRSSRSWLGIAARVVVDAAEVPPDHVVDAKP